MVALLHFFFMSILFRMPTLAHVPSGILTTANESLVRPGWAIGLH